MTADRAHDNVPAGLPPNAKQQINQLAYELRGAQQQARNLEAALANSRIISAAVGVVMHCERITYEEAFDRLLRTSQHANVKLETLADYVLYTGMLDQGPRASPLGPPASNSRTGSSPRQTT